MVVVVVVKKKEKQRANTYLIDIKPFFLLSPRRQPLPLTLLPSFLWPKPFLQQHLHHSFFPSPSLSHTLNLPLLSSVSLPPSVPFTYPHTHTQTLKNNENSAAASPNYTQKYTLFRPCSRHFSPLAGAVAMEGYSSHVAYFQLFAEYSRRSAPM